MIHGYCGCGEAIRCGVVINLYGAIQPTFETTVVYCPFCLLLSGLGTAAGQAAIAGHPMTCVYCLEEDEERWDPYIRAFEDPNPRFLQVARLLFSRAERVVDLTQIRGSNLHVRESAIRSETFNDGFVGDFILPRPGLAAAPIAEGQLRCKCNTCKGY